MRPKSVIPALLTLVVSTFVLLAGTAGAYVAEGVPWPGGVVRYYNAAPDQAWAVKRAVDAWNSSGARIQLIAVPPSQADVRIEHFSRVSCTINSEATVGYTRTARIWIFRRDDTSPYCNAYVAAEALAHEFGHVLGLGHETRVCAAMNSRGTLQGPDLCPKARRWQWRCRLLTADDVAGAIALYGGTATPPTSPRNCDLYRGIGMPTGLRVDTTSVSHEFRIGFRRPFSVTVPTFLSTQVAQTESFVMASSSSCPTDPYEFRRRLWSAPPGATEQTHLMLPSGVTCISVWAVDSFGRPSGRPAMLRVQVVETG
ncbi:MAG: hypothetical protein ACM3QU_14375 [Verrucomicrobiota bacterium]